MLFVLIAMMATGEQVEQSLFNDAERCEMHAYVLNSWFIERDERILFHCVAYKPGENV